MSQLFKTIGVMRFSVLTPTYYNEKFDSLEKIAAHIYSDSRMALRFHIFEKLVLPSLAKQSDPDFNLVILSGQAMPEKHKKRLNDLIAPYTNMRVDYVDTEDHYQLLKKGFQSVPLEGATQRLMFRLDDDDAVGIMFIERLKVIAEGLTNLMGDKVPQVIAFNRGFHVRIEPEGENEVFDTCERFPLSTGMALLAPAEYPNNPYRYNHRNSGQHFNTYSDIEHPMYIR
ncbi:MAG: glycosyltransferase, partial [Lentilitoribacter sp.]